MYSEYLFIRQTAPPTESQMSGREGVEIVVHEFQGRIARIGTVIKAGIQPDHAHCLNFLRLRGTSYNNPLYRKYFHDQYGLDGNALVDPTDPNIEPYTVSVDRDEEAFWPADTTELAFKLTDFPPLNTTRVADKEIGYHLIDFPLGEGVDRNRENMTEFVEKYCLAPIEEIVVPESGVRFINAFLSAIQR